MEFFAQKSENSPVDTSRRRNYKYDFARLLKTSKLTVFRSQAARLESDRTRSEMRHVEQGEAS
jgi:hypothetical protein